KAVDDLKNGRPHLIALQNAYDELEGIPDTDSLRQKIIDEISTLSEQYDDVERNCELSVADKGFNDVNKLRESLEKLSELKEQLTPLLKPAFAVEDFDNRLSNVNKIFQQWQNEIVHKKQELEAENNLSSLINDFERTLINAENDFEKLEGRMNALKNFRDMILPMVIEKSDRVRDLILPVRTENIQQLYHDVDILTVRFNNLSTRVNDKLNHAKEQENLLDNIQRELDNIEQKANDFLNKYITSQDLSIAIEDFDQLHSLLDQIPTSAMENITECELRENLLKKADTIKNQIKNLLVPLEKDIRNEQELMHDLHEILCTLTSIGDDVIAVDPITEPSQQLESIGQLTENLRKLKGKVEKVEGKLQSSEGMVKRALVTDDLYGRIVQLQNALDDKKRKLTDRAKLYAITPEISLINESVQNYVNEMEQIPLQTVEEQNAALSELEGKKHQLENLLENIPLDDEGNELREKGSRLLGQLNDILKRLAGAVGEKLAALAAFNAIKDEIETQLSSLQAIPMLISDEITISELDNRLHNINIDTEKLQKLKEKLLYASVSESDREQCSKRNDLLSKIDEFLLSRQKDHEYFEEKRIQLLTCERIFTDCKALYNELEKLIKHGQKLLNDSEALPDSYGSVSDALTTVIERAVNLRISEPKIEQPQELVFEQLWKLIDEARDVQTLLIQRVYVWEQFVKEHDSSMEKLNGIRRHICEIEGRGMRRFDQMLDDLEALKVLYLRWSFLASLPSQLLSLSSQLHPLAYTQREGKAFAEEASKLEKKIENLLDSMSAEFRVREEIVHSLLVISDELDDIKNAFNVQNISPRLQKKLQQRLEGIRAHLKTLDEDISKFNDNRIFLSEEEDIATKYYFERLEEIEEKLKGMELTDTEEFDVDAAAEVLATIYPDDHPRDVLREQGILFDDDDSYDLSPSTATSDDDKSKFKTPPDDELILEESEREDAVEAHPSLGVVALSPVPDDPSPGRVHYERQRSRWRRILRTALPLQAMLVLLLGAACLVPHCDDESCCQLLNNFARNFDPSLEFLNGPPPF
uniref:KASH domain-containing protein n=2 Tax=Loa loa TaxID=7209 RepID=A0A1I7VMX8_LOALO